MDDEWLAAQFEEHRGQLRAVALRMLGSASDADDAVQEAWLRLARTDPGEVRNLGAWLTTVVGRISLDQLRARRTRREDGYDDRWDHVVILPDPDPATDPEHEAVLADSLGLALMVVLDSLTPGERVAFVLHDLLAVPFSEVSRVLDRSEDATKMLASRARGKLRAAGTPPPGVEPSREVVDAFRAAARAGDFQALMAVLHPDVLVRAHTAGGIRETLGRQSVVEQARSFARFANQARRVLVDGAPGLLVASLGRPFALLAFTVRDGLITELEILADPRRLGRLEH